MDSPFNQVVREFTAMDKWLITIASTGGASFMATFLAILVCASVVILVLQRARVATIPAFLITGAIIGPEALGLVKASEALTDISHLAIILLMFGIGLDLHLSAFRHAMGRMIAVGVGSCALAVVVGWPVVLAFGVPAPAALAVSMALALSSTAIVSRLIMERRQLRHIHGRLSLAILVLQDLLVVGMLAALPLLTKWATARGDLASATEVFAAETGWARFAFDSLLRVGGIALLIIAGRLFLPRLMRESVRGGSLEVLLIVGASVAFGAAKLTQTLGFSLEIGAFLAGLMLSATPFRHQLKGQIGPLRDLFFAVFFTAVGMEIDPSVLLEYWWVVLLATAMMMAGKAALTSLSCWSIGATAATSLAVGLSLSQAGEFGLVLLSEARDSGLLSAGALDVVVGVVVTSLIVTPFADGLAARIRRSGRLTGLAPWIRGAALQSDAAEEQSVDAPRRIVIGGYGPVGQSIDATVAEAGYATTVIELNPETVRERSRKGESVVFGDMSSAAVLESAKIAGAEALVLTIPDERATIRACQVARRLAPELFIVARIGHVSRQAAAESAGADRVIVEETATAEEMLLAMDIKPLVDDPEDDMDEAPHAAAEDQQD